MKHSIINIQILRAIAAFLVVLDHYFAVPLKLYLSKDEFFLVHKYFNNLGEFAVLIFFLMSGFLMVFTQKDDKNAFNFLKDRLIRVYPPFVIFSLPIILYAVLYDKSIDTIYKFFQNISLLPGYSLSSYTYINFPAWSLVYEMYFYIVFSIILIFTSKKLNLTIALTILFVVILILSNWLVAPHSYYTSTSIETIIRNPVNLFFLAGCWIAILIDCSKNIVRISPYIFVGITLILSFLYPLIDFLSINKFVIGIVLATGIVYIGLIAKSFNSYILVQLGNASYTLYVIHVFFLIAIKPTAFKMLGLMNLSLMQFIFATFVYILLICFISILLYKTVEKPLVKYFKKVFN